MGKETSYIDDLYKYNEGFEMSLHQYEQPLLEVLDLLHQLPLNQGDHSIPHNWRI
jgi:hypothetical protein